MENYQNTIQDKRIKTTEEHIATINNELGSVKVDMAQVKTDVSWLKRFFFIVATTSMGSLIGVLINLMSKN